MVARAFALVCAALAVVEICAAIPLPSLHPWPWPNTLVAWISGALTLAGSLWLLRRPHGGVAGRPLAALWALACGACLWVAVQGPSDPGGWVAAAETLTFAVAAFAAPALSGPRAELALRIIFGLTLAGFGVVHLLFATAIAGLIPAWMPLRADWPYLTGAILLLCGAACALNLRTRIAVLVAAAMFASWIVLVHAPRIAAAPTDAFEWTFALTAVALIVVAVRLAVAAPFLGAAPADR